MTDSGERHVGMSLGCDCGEEIAVRDEAELKAFLDAHQHCAVVPLAAELVEAVDQS